MWSVKTIKDNKNDVLANFNENLLRGLQRNLTFIMELCWCTAGSNNDKCLLRACGARALMIKLNQTILKLLASESKI